MVLPASLSKRLENHGSNLPRRLTWKSANGVVTLNGEVPSLSHKRLAGVLAWWVPGTRDVINGLEEVPPEEDNDDELIDAMHVACWKKIPL